MTPTARPALLWSILALGLAGNALFRVDALGLNVLLWFGGAALAWYLHRRWVGAVIGEAERALLAVIVLLASTWVWRTNEVLLFLNAVALVLSAALMPLAALPAPGTFATLTPERGLRALGALAERGITGLLPTLVEAQSRAVGDGDHRRGWVAPVVRGAVLAVPALLVFGALLGSADPVFETFLTDLVRVDVERLISHLFGTLAAAWVAAAALRGMLPESARWAVGEAPVRLRGLGAIEVGVVLGLVDLLFAAFVAFQLPYLFGGAGWVERTAGVTLAEYARRGFFELVTVSGLVLPLLLVMAGRLAPGDRAAWRTFRSLAGIQVLLVLGITGSAAHRMALYQGSFGLTEDRFFATAVMAGVAVSLLWFGATVLRERAALFARGALGAWGAWLFVLNVANPERVIVETNLRRLAAGATFDLSYHVRLSADAAPALVAALREGSSVDAAQLRDNLVANHAQAIPEDWRAWNLSRSRARSLVRSLGSPGAW